MTIILGIDPGSRITGYGLIKVSSGMMQYLDSGCIKTQPRAPLYQRLHDIFSGIKQITEYFNPDEIGIEQVFMHQNANTALKLGHARGVAMVCASMAGQPVYEYSARQIKQAVVGYGAADKKQVQMMVQRLLNLSKIPQVDASDALAVTICHMHARRNRSMLNQMLNH